MTAALEIRGLGKRFGGLQVIDDVSLVLEAGARHALIGPNGAGKTTLVSLMSGVLAPDSGTVRVFGVDVTRVRAEARVKAGLVRSFQVNSLFPGLSVLDNVLLAVSERRGESRRMFAPMSARANLIDDAMSHIARVGLSSLAREPVARLAYGPQRLVEFAIALSLSPKVLLLDEPAAGLPQVDAHRILDVIEALPADLAVMMIEHDMALVRRFAREVTVLASGAVLVTGAPDMALADARVRRVYLGRDRGELRGASHA